MLDFINDIDSLEKEANGISDFMNITCSEDPNEAVERGNQIQVYIARTGKMLADAKYHYDRAILQNTISSIKEFPEMSPMVRKQYVEASCFRKDFLVTWIDRLNRASTHQSEWLRTVISKAKAEFMQTR